MKSEVLYHPVVNFLALMIGISVCGAIWGMAAPISDVATVTALGPMPMQNGAFEGLGDFFSIIWLGVRVLFWLVVGLTGTAVVLFVLASVGVIAWVVQQLAKGFVWVSSMIRGLIDEMTNGPAPEAAVVAKTPEGKPVSVKEILADYQERLTTLEKKYDELRLQSTTQA